MTTYKEVQQEIDALEIRLKGVDNLNQTLLTATTAYQIRMARQELTIMEQRREIEDLRAGKEVLLGVQFMDQEKIDNLENVILTLKGQAGI